MKRLITLFLCCTMLVSSLCACDLTTPFSATKMQTTATEETVNLQNLPEYTDSPFVTLQATPSFTEKERESNCFESYSDWDTLGRCGVAFACIGTALMPTEKRESISSVKPSGWCQKQYDFVDGKSLYNRCHLIGYQLTGENANEKNLITGTRYFNVDGMLPFENMVADYIKETGNRVLYRVTPDFREDDLVAHGVRIEALSVEDGGDGICFDVYIYNVQPGVEIDYATGENHATGVEEVKSNQPADYILNTSGKKFHLPSCPSVQQISAKNRQEYSGTRESLIAEGYIPCKNCNP